MTESYVYRAGLPPYEKQARVDGDTYWMDLDLGLRIWTKTKSRPRGDTTPELSVDGGNAAKDLALGLLYRANQIVVRTSPLPPTHERWKGDLFGYSDAARPAEVGSVCPSLGAILFSLQYAKLRPPSYPGGPNE